MAEGGHISTKRISDITECSICKETCKDPRFLPCIHTFCFGCLERYSQGKHPGENLNCPMCRKICTIPRGGIKEFPANYFTNRLIDEINLASSTESGVQLCEMCCAVKERTAATLYCMVCLQNMCKSCCVRHKTQRMARGHQVVALKDKPSVEELSKLAPSYCEQHPTDEIKFYCNDCKMVACVVCQVAKHSKHDCCDVIEWAESFRIQLKDDIERVSPYISKCLEEMKELRGSKTRLNSNAIATKKEIRRKYNELMFLLDSHKDDLITKVDSLKATVLKQLEVREKEVDEQLVILDSFKKYCEEMKEKGTASDVARDASDLHTRADELLKIHQESGGIPLLPVDICFNASSVMISDNCIGKLKISEVQNSLIVIGLDLGHRTSNDVCRINLDQPDSVSAVSKLPTTMLYEPQACLSGSSVFLTGCGEGVRETWELNLISGAWIELAKMTIARSGHCALIVDTVLYVLGGNSDSNAELSSVESYNRMTNTWSPAGNLVHAVANCASITYKNSIYVFGGSSHSDAIAYVQVYNPATHQCTPLDTPIPFGSLTVMRAVLWETFAILMHCDTCLVYSFETQTWLEREWFETGVKYFGFVIDNQTIYIAGGGTSIEDDKENTLWTCTDEIKSVSVLDIIEDKHVVWKHHAKLPRPAMIDAYCSIVPATMHRSIVDSE